jgi:hypothetical protein
MNKDAILSLVSLGLDLASAATAGRGGKPVEQMSDAEIIAAVEAIQITPADELDAAGEAAAKE